MKTRTIEIMVLALVLIVLAVKTSSVQTARLAESGREYASDSILVRFREGASPTDQANAHAQVGADRVQEYHLVPGLQNIRLKAGGIGVEAAIERLSRLPFVEYAVPDYAVHTTEITPSDPKYGNLWGMTNIHAPAAWDIYKGDGSVVVASLDTGIDYNHEDLAGNIWINPDEVRDGLDNDGNGYIDDIYGWDFAYNDNDPADVKGHGSHTSGTAGAVGDNGVGVAGVNWNVKLMALKFLDDRGTGYTSNAILALEYAVAKGVKVSNNSWGGPDYTQALYDAILSAREAGHLFVAAAGNGGRDLRGDNNDQTPFFPASYNLENIIAVAAIDEKNAKARFSNYGLESVDLGAPGVGICSTLPGNLYAFWEGTSMATPHVAGVAALLFGKNPQWTYTDVKIRILSTARSIPSLTGKTVTGGTLDAGAALAPVPAQLPAVPTGLTASPSSSSQIDLAWTDNADDETGFSIERCKGPACTNFTRVATVVSETVRFADAGLGKGTTYSYRVQAFNASGASGYSNIATATTPRR